MIAATVVVALALGGCGSTSGNQASPPLRQQNAVQGNGARMNQTTGNTGQPVNIQSHLEQLASSVPGVRGATVVMLGRTAIVGLDVEANLPRTRVGTLKYTVAQALRKDPNGANAVVTADMDLAARVRGIRAAINAGSPASGFAGELSQIVGRIAPEFPRGTTAPGQHP